MSLQTEDLVVEVNELWEELRALKREVNRLRRLVEAGGSVSGGGTASATSQLDVHPEVAESDGSYSHLTPPAAPVESQQVPLSGGTGNLVVVPEQAQIGGPLPLTWAQREIIARDIGHWLLQAVRGARRGPSGRDRLPYSSRVWLVFKDFVGDIQDPVLVFNSWHACKLQVRRGASFGESVFIGLPSLRECRWVVEATGFQWPN